MRTGESGSTQQGWSAGRCGSIDLLRFVYAVIIVLHHSRYVLGDDDCVFLGGSLAVEFFFFVSGYLLLVSVEKALQRGTVRVPSESGREKTSDSSVEVGVKGRPSVDGAASGIGTENGAVPVGIGTETFRFLLRKIRSFLPEFLIAWVIGFLFTGFVQQWSLRDAWTAFLEYFWELTLVRMSGLYTGGIDGVIWYLSAMLLGMAVLYPLLRRHEDVMTHIVCPLLCLFLYGWLCAVYGHPRNPGKWIGFAYKGLIRGLAGLCVGVTARMAVRKLRGLAFTAFGSVLITLAEIFCLVMSIRYMYLWSPSKTDYFYMFLMLILVILCFSELGAENSFFHTPPMRRLCGFLSKYSLTLYLSHLYFAANLNTLLDGILSGSALSGEEISGGVLLTGVLSDGITDGPLLRMGIYLALAFANGLLVLGLSTLWRRHADSVRGCLRRLLIRQDPPER